MKEGNELFFFVDQVQCMARLTIISFFNLLFLNLKNPVLTAEEASLLALEYNVNPIVGSTESLFDLTSQYVYRSRPSTAAYHGQPVRYVSRLINPSCFVVI